MPVARECKLEVTQTILGRTITLSSGTYKVSTDLVPAPDTTYNQMLKMVPAGYRPSALETVRYALQREKKLKNQDKDTRIVLEDKLFGRYFDSDRPMLERTGAFFMAPKGKKKIGAYIDEEDGKRYARGVRFGVYDKIIFEDIRLPLMRDGIIVEWDDNGLPAEISKGSEPQIWHLWVDEEAQEVGVILCGDWYCDEGDRCLTFYADWPRSHSYENAAFRLVQGSIKDYEYPKAKS